MFELSVFVGIILGQYNDGISERRLIISVWKLNGVYSSFLFDTFNTYFLEP